jgi:multidrug efflux pump subunit AcrA (membrane-fusion protein)
MDTNSYNATVSILRPDGMNILTGMTGQVFLANTKQANQIQLPHAAWVSREGNQGSIWRFEAKTSSVHLVELEVNEAGFVTKGLNGGDLVVIAGAKDLREGQVVRAWEREGGI